MVADGAGGQRPLYISIFFTPSQTMKKILLLVILSGVEGLLHAQPTPFQWKQVAPGVWKATVGKPEAISPLSVAEIKPRVEGLQKLGTPPFPNELKESKNERTDGKVYLRFPLERGEQLYGLGLNFKSVQQRGTIKTLHVDHYGGKDDGRTHAPVPFYVSDRGYGVLINSARYVTVYAGSAVRKDSKNPPRGNEPQQPEKLEFAALLRCGGGTGTRSGDGSVRFCGKECDGSRAALQLVLWRGYPAAQLGAGV